MPTLEMGVLMSIHKNWLDLILLGKKTVEARKSILFGGQCDKPFPIWFYETKKSGGCGAVVGTAICSGFCVLAQRSCVENEIFYNDSDLERACLSQEQAAEYMQNRGDLYGWKLKNAETWEKPMALEDFENICGEPIKRPPVSWQYVWRERDEGGKTE